MWLPKVRSLRTTSGPTGHELCLPALCSAEGELSLTQEQPRGPLPSAPSIMTSFHKYPRVPTICQVLLGIKWCAKSRMRSFLSRSLFSIPDVLKRMGSPYESEGHGLCHKHLRQREPNRDFSWPRYPVAITMATSPRKWQ